MPLDLSYDYNVAVGIIAILGLLSAGFISGIFYWAAKEAEKDRPPFLKKHGLYYAVKIGEYTLLIASLYFLFVSLGWITTLVAYLLMEYRLHHILKPVYRKYFGIPTDKAAQSAD